MTRPTVLDSLMAAGLNPELVAAFRDRHVKHRPCQCSACVTRRNAGNALPPEADVPVTDEPAPELDAVAARYLFPDEGARP